MARAGQTRQNKAKHLEQISGNKRSHLSLLWMLLLQLFHLLSICLQFHPHWQHQSVHQCITLGQIKYRMDCCEMFYRHLCSCEGEL